MKRQFHQQFNECTVGNILKSFSVSSEDELLQKLAKESETLTCAGCFKEFSIEEMKFIDSDPFCKNCR